MVVVVDSVISGEDKDIVEIGIEVIGGEVGKVVAGVVRGVVTMGTESGTVYFGGWVGVGTLLCFGDSGGVGDHGGVGSRGET